MSIPRILVVEDDDEMRAMLTRFLQNNGVIALEATSEDGIRHGMENGRIDLILLDVMLEAANGIEICARLREEHSVPIIMVSAMSTDQHRMAGYSAGADDYIAKPFNAELLMARIKAVLTRSRRSASLFHRRRQSKYSFAGWEHDARTDEVMSPDGYELSLSQRERALLHVFLANPHIPLTRDEIVEGLSVTNIDSGGVDVSGRAIDMLVGRLRAKIERDPRKPQMLKTQRGVGYVWSVDVTESAS